MQKSQKGFKLTLNTPPLIKFVTVTGEVVMSKPAKTMSKPLGFSNSTVKLPGSVPWLPNWRWGSEW